MDMADDGGGEQRICEEYQYLIEKAHQLFSGLRDLPQVGQKHWQPYFQKTFDVYTKLWKYQQQNRTVLENKRRYGLKRWEIGEIASKIGQLYYHYYLRTSETNYLHESYVFYEAIRSRGYFKNILEAKSPSLVIRKLRYYARFVVVCLLLGRKEVASQLMAELRQLVEQYSRVFRPSDAREWQLVLQEIGTFMQADMPLVVTDRPDGTPPLSFRVPAVGCTGDLRLGDVVLLSNQRQQVKFSELTLDMFRIVQSLEYEFGVRSSATKEGSDSEPLPTNPHKYLLYRPTLPSLLTYLASALKEMPESGVLMVYIVADGAWLDQQMAVGAGGLLMNPGKEVTKPRGAAEDVDMAPSGKDDAGDASPPKPDMKHCLRPSDLVPFSRKPLFLVVDSNASSSFKSFPNEFDEPLVVLLSPEIVPPGLKEPEQTGGLLTLFFNSPLLGFMCVCDVSRTTQAIVDDCERIISEYLSTVQRMLESGDDVDWSFRAFMQDDFLRAFIIRFVFCCAVLRQHKSCANQPRYLPTSTPSLPDSMILDGGAKEVVGNLVAALKLPNERNPFLS